MRNAITALLLVGALAALALAIIIPARIGHPVTPQMSSAAREAVGRAVKPLPGTADAHVTVVVFILPGCPCSEAYEPYTHELFAAFGSNVSMIGVVSGDQTETADWARAHQTPYQLISDLDNSIAKDFQAERSAYTALVVGGTQLKKLWPGYSKAMLFELADLIAAESRPADLPPLFENAPDKLTSGCMLDIE